MRRARIGENPERIAREMRKKRGERKRGGKKRGETAGIVSLTRGSSTHEGEDPAIFVDLPREICSA